MNAKPITLDSTPKFAVPINTCAYALVKTKNSKITNLVSIWSKLQYAEEAAERILSSIETVTLEILVLNFNENLEIMLVYTFSNDPNASLKTKVRPI